MNKNEIVADYMGLPVGDITEEHIKWYDSQNIQAEEPQQAEEQPTQTGAYPDGLDSFIAEMVTPFESSEEMILKKNDPNAYRLNSENKKKELWANKDFRDQFAIYKRDKLTKPTLDQWREMPFNEKVESYRMITGKPMEEVRELISATPSSVEADIFKDSPNYEGSVVGSFAKDALTSLPRGAYGLLNASNADSDFRDPRLFQSKSGITSESANGIVESYATDPMTLLTAPLGVGGKLLGNIASQIPKLGGLLGGAIAKSGYAGGLYGLGQTASESFRPEGVTFDEGRNNILGGALGDVAVGGLFKGFAKAIPDRVAKATMPGDVYDNKEVLSWASTPENRALMGKYKGKGREVGLDIMEEVSNPNMFKQYESIERALDNMPDIDGSQVIAKMREAIPLDMTDFNTKITSSIAKKKQSLDAIKRDIGPNGLTDVQKRNIGSLTNDIKALETKLNNAPDNITMFQEGGAIATANEQLEFLAKQIDGKMINPKTLRDLRIKMDKYIDWDKEGMDQAHEIILKDLLYNGRTAIKEGLESSAMSVGDLAYVNSMRKLEEGFKVREGVTDIMPKKHKGIEAWVGNSEGLNKTAQHEALDAYDDFFGTDFSQKSKAVANAKILQVNPATGMPSNAHLWQTGGKSTLSNLVSPSSAGGIIKTAESVSDVLSRPNIGASLNRNTPTYGLGGGFIDSTANTIEKSLFGNQTEDEYYNQGFN